MDADAEGDDEGEGDDDTDSDDEGEALAVSEGIAAGDDASDDGDASLSTSRSRVDTLTSADADALGVTLAVTADGDGSRASLGDELGDGVESDAVDEGACDDDALGPGVCDEEVGVGVASGSASNDVLTHRSGTPSGHVEAAAAGCAESRGATRRAHDAASATALTRWDLTMLSLRRGRGE